MFCIKIICMKIETFLSTKYEEYEYELQQFGQSCSSGSQDAFLPPSWTGREVVYRLSAWSAALIRFRKSFMSSYWLVLVSYTDHLRIRTRSWFEPQLHQKLFTTTDNMKTSRKSKKLNGPLVAGSGTGHKVCYSMWSGRTWAKPTPLLCCCCRRVETTEV